MQEANEKSEHDWKYGLSAFAKQQILDEKEKADFFVQKHFGDCELAEQLQNSNYFMNPQARKLFEKQVFYQILLIKGIY